MLTREEIIKQIDELIGKYQYLSLAEKSDEKFIIKGKFVFSASYNNITLSDEFEIEIHIPKEYPEVIPSIWETGKRIPNRFHKMKDKSLCLGASVAIRQKVNTNMSVLSFVEEFLVPYLYSFCYKEKYGEMPYGELSHGAKGILEYYQELFGEKSKEKTLSLLKYLAENNYRGHQNCPCGSGKKLRKCHGDIILGAINSQKQIYFCYDYFYCLEYCGYKVTPKTVSYKIAKCVEKFLEQNH